MPAQQKNSLCGSVNTVQAATVSDAVKILKKYNISKCDMARIMGLLDLFGDISDDDRNYVRNSLCGSVNSIGGNALDDDIVAILENYSIDICKLQDIVKNESKYKNIIKELDGLSDADIKAIKKMGSSS